MLSLDTKGGDDSEVCPAGFTSFMFPPSSEPFESSGRDFCQFSLVACHTFLDAAGSSVSMCFPSDPGVLGWMRR